MSVDPFRMFTLPKYLEYNYLPKEAYSLRCMIVTRSFWKAVPLSMYFEDSFPIGRDCVGVPSPWKDVDLREVERAMQEAIFDALRPSQPGEDTTERALQAARDFFTRYWDPEGEGFRTLLLMRKL